MGKILVVIDMQNDFVTGSLGSKEAVEIVPKVVEKIKNFDGQVIFTRDTHQTEYMSTQEGKHLPVEHCIENTKGWEIIPQLNTFSKLSKIINKPTFGSIELAEYIYKEYEKDKSLEVELIGLCTDICVVSNALILKATMPELKITLDSSCCAGVTVQKHEAALETMKSCQIDVY